MKLGVETLNRISVILVVALFLCLSGCTKKSETAIMYNDSIELGQYRGVEIEKIIPKEITTKDVQLQIDYLLKEKAAGSTIPELTEDTVKTLFGYASVKEYKEQIRKNLEKTERNSAKMEQSNMAWDRALANAKMKKYPKELLARNLKTAKASFQRFADTLGMSYADAIVYCNMSEGDIEEQAKEYVKSDLMVKAIADAENISISKKEINSEVKKQMLAFGFKTQEELESYYGSFEKMKAEFLANKIFEFVSDNATIK